MISDFSVPPLNKTQCHCVALVKTDTLVQVFTFVGGIEADINVPEIDFIFFLEFWDIDISASTPPTDVKVTPKCLFSQVLRNDIEFCLGGGGTEKI